MPLARVNDGQSRGARRAEQAAAGFDNGAQHRDIVAKGGTEATGLEKIPLHVDEQEGRRLRIDGNRSGLCVYRDANHVRCACPSLRKSRSGGKPIAG
jgi:hypothetical protein